MRALALKKLCYIYQITNIKPIIYRYLLRNAWLSVLILLAMPPCCMLLSNASSSADCVTEASVNECVSADL